MGPSCISRRPSRSTAAFDSTIIPTQYIPLLLCDKISLWGAPAIGQASLMGEAASSQLPRRRDAAEDMHGCTLRMRRLHHILDSARGFAGRWPPPGHRAPTKSPIPQTSPLARPCTAAIRTMTGPAVAVGERRPGAVERWPCVTVAGRPWVQTASERACIMQSGVKPTFFFQFRFLCLSTTVRKATARKGEILRAQVKLGLPCRSMASLDVSRAPGVHEGQTPGPSEARTRRREKGSVGMGR